MIEKMQKKNKREFFRVFRANGVTQSYLQAFINKLNSLGLVAYTNPKINFITRIPNRPILTILGNCSEHERFSQLVFFKLG